ncbi:MAG: NusG domain II-containing protein [Eubacteriales bacterium]|jgi:hypothetical protein
MKRGDKALLAGLVLCLAAAGLYFIWPRQEAGVVMILQDEQLLDTLPLDTDCVYPIGEGNVLEIRDGKAFMQSADCPDQICVHMAPISREGETIVCLPHKVVIKARGGSQSDLDGLSQ